MKPDRTAVLARALGYSLGALFSVSLTFAAGCLAGASRSVPARALPDAEARQAGALALYAQGLLLESAEGAETNGAKAAAGGAFAQAVQLDPDNRRPLAALLSNLSDRRLYADALDAAERYLAQHPQDAEIRLEAARAADATNRPAVAAAHCEALLAAQPDNRELAQSVIRLRFQAGQSEAALAALRAQHLRFNDSTSAALPVQWAVYFSREAQQPALALDCLRLAVTQRTNAAERAALLTLAGENQLALGRTNDAVEAWLDAYRVNPAFHAPLQRAGAVRAAEPGGVGRLARLAGREGPEADTSRLLLAAAQQAAGDLAAAAATLRDAHARRLRASDFPDEGFYLWLGGLLEELKAADEIQPLLREALSAHPASHELKNFLAYHWAERNVRLDEANRLANEALAEEPDNAAYLDTKGWVLYRAGRVYDALQCLLRAAELDKTEPVILDHVGDALLAAGRESDAQAFWARSYQFEPAPNVAAKLKARGVTPSAPRGPAAGRPGEAPARETPANPEPPQAQP